MMSGHIPRVALTGGIASGKSAVAMEFSKFNIPIIDTDEIARDVVSVGKPALKSIVDHFGSKVLTANSALDRKQLREVIFNNPVDKQALESILHPIIRAEQLQRANIAGGPYQIHVIPLLTETGTYSQYDRVLLVDCPREIQLQRLISRDGIVVELAERMIAAQASRERRLAIADDVIDNSGDQQSLSAAVAKLHQKYLKDLANRA